MHKFSQNFTINLKKLLAYIAGYLQTQFQGNFQRIVVFQTWFNFWTENFLKIKLNLKYLSLCQASVAFKPSNVKIHRKNYLTENNIQKKKLITYAIISWPLIVSFDKKYSIKPSKHDFLNVFHRFALKQIFLRKLSDIAFVYLLCPITLKKILRSGLRLQNKVALFLPKQGPNCPFSPKEMFWQSCLLLCIATLFLLATAFQKNSQRANHKTEGCIILAQSGCDLLPQKGTFWKSWPKLLWYKYCIPPCYAISKRLAQSRSWE